MKQFVRPNIFYITDSAHSNIRTGIYTRSQQFWEFNIKGSQLQNDMRHIGKEFKLVKQAIISDSDSGAVLID